MHHRLALCAVFLLVCALPASADVQHHAIGLDRSFVYDVQQGEQIIATGLVPGPSGDISFFADEDIPIHIFPSGEPGDLIPPAPVDDLTVDSTTQTSATLSWTAVGDDGHDGRASTYDIRYSTTQITGATWDSANRATGEPNPGLPGADEEFTVAGLTPGTTYYFAIKVADERSNWSELSNVPWAETEEPDEPDDDTTPPAEVSDLDLDAVEEFSVTLTWTAVGDDGHEGRASTYDIRYSTMPINAQSWDIALRAEGEPAPQAGGAVETFTIEGLQDGTRYYFALKVADEAPNWSGISNIISAETVPDQDLEAPDEVLTLQVAEASRTSIWLTWTAVGDDGKVGQASLYDIRYDTEAITGQTWDDAIQVDDEPEPKPAWQQENFVVAGLEEGTTYHFALKVADEIPNWSGLSNVASATTAERDTIGPDTITDLAVDETDETSISLTWTAVGDDGLVGRAAVYDIRYDTEEITSGTWSTATEVEGEPSPQGAGSEESFAIEGLETETEYYFAIRVADEVFNWSEISNVVSDSTSPPPPDTEPPAAIADLAAGAATDSSITLEWTAVGDDGNEGRASVYDIRYATFPIDESNWSEAIECVDEPFPKSRGWGEEFEVCHLEDGTTYYFAIVVGDEIPNWGEISNVASDATETTPDTIEPEAIVDLTADDVIHHAVYLSWTAPADDVETESVASYEGRVWSDPIDEDNWDDADPLTGLPVPSAPGEVEIHTVDDLDPGQTYFVALRSLDEAANASPISNLLEITTTSAPDIHPPQQIIDLFADSRTATTITLHWSSPADSVPPYCIETPEVVRYEIRFALTSLEGDGWDVGTPVAGPDPESPGTRQELMVKGLVPETIYYFAIRSQDARGNWSLTSNIVTESTGPPSELPDTTDPDPVVDLEATALNYEEVLLTWTAPRDDAAGGQCDHYDIRRSSEPLIGQAWENAIQILPPLSCKPAGEPESLRVTGLEPLTTYYFAVCAIDSSGNTGPVSISDSTRTPIGPDITPPSPVTNLTAIDSDTTSITLRWTTPLDDRGRCASYEMRYATTGINEVNWGSATPVEGLRIPLDPGMVDTVRVTGLPSGSGFAFALRSFDTAGNLSALSNVVWAETEEPDEPEVDTTAPAMVGNLFATPLDETRVVLTWTAVGDDETNGRASFYMLRHSTVAIDSTNWDSAHQIHIPFAPGEAGQSENLTVTGLEPDTDHYFVIVAVDEVGNRSPFSQNAFAHTPLVPDTQAPTAPMTLTAVDQDDRVLITWLPSPDPDVVDYIIYRREVGPAPTESVAFLDIRGVEYEDLIVLPDVEYAYAIAARDGAGNISPKTEEVFVRTELEGFLPEITDFRSRHSVEISPEDGMPRAMIEWSAVEGERFAGFIVERSDDAGESWQRRTETLLKGRESYTYQETIGQGTFVYRIAAVSPRGYMRQFDPMTVSWLGESFGTTIDGPFPNPSPGQMNLSLHLARDEHVTVTLFDPSGRMMGVVAERNVPAGMHPMMCDAVESLGEPLASGVYFLGIEVGHDRFVRKVIVRK